MTTQSSVEWLSAAIKQATKSAKYCVAAEFPNVDPCLEVEGLGPVPLPLKPKQAKAFIASCHIAAFGKGTQTLVDRNVRNTYELNPDQFRLSEAWNLAVGNVARSVASELGLPPDQMEAQLYKLLVYERGGFFLPHRDSEKQNGMVASLVVVLPNSFEGGQLYVRHGTNKTTVNFPSAVSGRAPSYAAFFADCEHEVTRVGNGRRICLTYNLVLKKPQKKVAIEATPTHEMADSIRVWTATQPGNPLVIALEHHYTERGLSLDLMKGADRKLAELIIPAAQDAGCVAYFSQVERHLIQFADDGSYGSDSGGYRGGGFGRRSKRGPLEIGETYTDDLLGMQWTDLEGNKQPWTSIPFKVPAIVSSIPLNKWKPTSEEFEGYTGNAGNTLDRWYHRTALVIWRVEDHFDVIASGDLRESMSLFRKMFEKLAQTAKKRQEEARRDLILFASAIMRRWSSPGYYRRYDSSSEQQKNEEEFAATLVKLQDQALISSFLSKLAEGVQIIRLGPFLISAGKEFGWDTFSSELKLLMSPKPTRTGSTALSKWNVDWLVDFCSDRTPDADKISLAQELCASAVDQFCVSSSPPRYPGRGDRPAQSESEAIVPLLATALLAIGSTKDLSKLLNFLQSQPRDFRLDECHVPALKKLIPWSKKALGEVPEVLTGWLTTVRQKLEELTAQAPLPPTDWKRSADIQCNCQFCAQLNAFLADPTNEVGRIAAREQDRQHLTMKIHQHECDLMSKLEKTGSPYSLVLTKTTASFERALKEFRGYEKTLKELSKLPGAKKTQ